MPTPKTLKSLGNAETFTQAQEIAMSKRSGRHLDHALPRENGAPVGADVNRNVNPLDTGETRPVSDGQALDLTAMIRTVRLIKSLSADNNVFPDSFSSMVDYVESRRGTFDNSEPSLVYFFVNTAIAVLALNELNRGCADIGPIVDELARVFWVSVGCDEYAIGDETMRSDLNALVAVGYSTGHLLMSLMAPCPEALKTKTWKPEYEYLIARVAARIDPLIEAANKK